MSIRFELIGSAFIIRDLKRGIELSTGERPEATVMLKPPSKPLR